ncbi:hypothetical protein LAZ67_7002976 [Cordylochernes scorpioides]|uniref:Uncharacterized protein n=1 Tax=Cordylochernes scorpioides TaxID=51811 RepID=A0ABY6KNK9_9ARAC|nr:hypothetical protein LAZ67_7002976 [Cordylochernes scorpioides]
MADINLEEDIHTDKTPQLAGIVIRVHGSDLIHGQDNTTTNCVDQISSFSTNGDFVQLEITKNLKKYPYKIQRFHELKVGDFEKRQEFAAWVFRQIDIDENWLSNNLTLKTAVFGQQKTLGILQKCHFISPELQFEINGRTFKTVSVTGERYVHFLREKTSTKRNNIHANGGPPYISRGAKQLLKDTFGEDRVISRHFIYQWSPRSPDLTPCDFWLWGRHVSPISTVMLFNAVQSVIYRLQAVFENEGRHIEQGL